MCLKVMKMLIEISGLPLKDKRESEESIKLHVEECETCASFWNDLRDTDVLQNKQSKRAWHQENSQAPGIGVLLIGAPITEKETTPMTNIESIGTETEGKFFTIFVDDIEFHIEQATITGGEIMDLAGIPRDVGLVMVLDDGTQVSVEADEEIQLQPGRRFKKAPRFIRG